MKKLTLNVKGKTHNFQIPTSYNELTAKQYLFYVESVYPYYNAIFAVDKNGRVFIKNQQLYFQLRISLIYILSDMDFKHFEKISPAQLHGIIDGGVGDFLFAENNLTKQLIPELKTPLAVFYGPKDFLDNVCVEQFGFAWAFYNQYKKNQKNEGALNKLLASLYQAGAYNKDRIESTSTLLAEIPIAQKMGILLWFEGCVSQMKKREPDAFKGGEKGGQTKWSEVILELAGGKFGDYEKTAATPIKLVLSEMARLNRTAANQKENLKRLK